MEQVPCPIVVVTSSAVDYAAYAFKAMGVGALDAVNTPVRGAGIGVVGVSDLLAKIDTIEKLIKNVNPERAFISSNRAKQFVKSAVPLVVVGASSGGPQVLVEILAELPKDFHAAVTVVDATFAEELASWLDQQYQLSVRTAVQGKMPVLGEISIAQTNDHLRLDESGCFIYVEDPRELAYCPSADVFFESVAAHWRGPVLGVLLTGMERDGVSGSPELRKRCVFTMAQDRKTSAVFGMPKAAIEINAVVRVGSLAEMAGEIRSWRSVRESIEMEIAYV